MAFPALGYCTVELKPEKKDTGGIYTTVCSEVRRQELGQSSCL